MKSNISSLVENALIKASSTFSKDKKRAYQRSISCENNCNAKWVLETIANNANIAEKCKSPLCDDTGIPHIVLEIGPKINLNGNILFEIEKGVKNGLKKLPGRPMAIVGNDYERIGQMRGISENPEDVEMAPILIRRTTKNILRLNILMFGGGPAIRAKTFRVFHKHDSEIVVEEIIKWSKEMVSELGCSPCTIAVGIGRSHFEASSLMLEALIDGNYDKQTDIEKRITFKLNQTGVGPLGIGGKTSVLATFLKVGPQRSSGVRIVCVRPCCCFEPRKACIDLLKCR